MFDIRTDRRGHRWSRLVAAPLGVVALVGLAACGTGTDTTAASSGSASTGTSAAQPTAGNAAGGQGSTAMAAYVSCLEENGVTMPEPPAGRGSGGTPPQGGSGGTPPSGAPEPPADGGQGGGPGGGGGAPGEAPEGVDADTWAAAQEACAALAPTPPGGAAPSSGSGT